MTIPSNPVQQTSFFDRQCDHIGHFLDTHRFVYKVVLIASHIFRATAMYGLMQTLPLSLPFSSAIMLAASLMYRASIERFCSFRFALPSFVGSLAIWAAQAATVSLIAGNAFSSLSSIALTAGSGLAILSYCIFICVRSHLDIERHMQNLNNNQCCH